MKNEDLSSATAEFKAAANEKIQSLYHWSEFKEIESIFVKTFGNIFFSL